VFDRKISIPDKCVNVLRSQDMRNKKSPGPEEGAFYELYILKARTGGFE
jgi:hypothetical protein